jgi:hypothetical protein
MKTRATGLEDGVIVNPRHAMARAEDVRILEYYDKARGVAEGLVDDEACEAWVLIQHPIDEEPDVSVIFNDPEGVITRHWPPNTRDFRLVGGPSADQMPPLWNDSCYIGPDADITEAMADILCPADMDVGEAEDGALVCGEADPVQVLAVYRLKTDQTWDTWFPEDPAGEREPALSSMTELDPYDQLFILMSDNVWWTQEVTAGPKRDQVDLVEKWNSVCYAGASKAPANATAGIANDFVILFSLSDQMWLRYVPSIPWLTNMVNLDQYTSVLLLVTTSAGTTWVFDP